MNIIIPQQTCNSVPEEIAEAFYSGEFQYYFIEI